MWLSETSFLGTWSSSPDYLCIKNESHTIFVPIDIIEVWFVIALLFNDFGPNEAHLQQYYVLKILSKDNCSEVL